MTAQELADAGYAHRCLNGGRMHDWAKSLQPDKHPFEYTGSQLLVRFWEWKHRPFTVYLQFPHYMCSLAHITTIEQLEQLYALLRSPEAAA